MEKKRFALASLAFCVSASAAAADPVPAVIQKSLKPFSLQSTEFSQGVLRITAAAPTVGWDMYKAITANGICGSLYDDKKLASKIKKVEVVNSVGAQGYALAGGGKTCIEYGNVPGDKSDSFLKARTEECVARVCRKQN